MGRVVAPPVDGSPDGEQFAIALAPSASSDARSAPLGRAAELAQRAWRGSADGLSATRRALAQSVVGERARAFFHRSADKPRRATRTAAGAPKRGFRRYRTPAIVSTVLIIVLLATLLPPILALSRALQDYNELKGLGESGLHHLLAVKDDLSALASLGSGSGTSLLQPPPPLGKDTPYTYLLQRQAGTFYPMTVTVHPSPQLSAKGNGPATYTPTLSANTPVEYAAPPKPTPTATPTATPSPTPKPTPATTPGATGSPTPDSTPTSLIPDPKSIQSAHDELVAAQKDFAQLRSRLNNPDWVLSTAGAIPNAGSKLVSVKAMADVGYDISAIGIEFTGAVLPVLTRLHAGPLSSDQGILTQSDLDALQTAMTHTGERLVTIQARLASINLDDLPVTAAQKQTFTNVTAQLPHIEDILHQAGPYLTMAAWILGVGQPRNFLVQTLDRAELRPSGGFTGDYGILTISNGKLAPFELYNINDIDYGYKTNGWIFGKRPPPEYSWWPFTDWGLRDSNVSADYPTTAKIAIDLFRNEGGGNVDGVIQITPVVIQHVLKVTGPIFVPDYNETITSDNLEERIHYYQQDPAGIAIEQKLNPNDHTFSLRKRFTQLVVRLVQDKVKHLPTNQLIPMAKVVLDDLRSKDVQVYVTDPQVESYLEKLGASGKMDTTPGIDSFFMVQANVTVAKATPYIEIRQTDDVTLDAQGGATHRYTATFYNNPTADVYGYSTYRDFVRIYVPPQARLQRASGWDMGKPYCWTPPVANPLLPPPTFFTGTQPCPPNPYDDSDLYCPNGNYLPGPIAYTTFSDGRTDWGLDLLGPPPYTQTDVPGRAMWGGYVVVPRLCTATISMRWYVPGVVHQ